MSIPDPFSQRFTRMFRGHAIVCWYGGALWYWDNGDEEFKPIPVEQQQGGASAWGAISGTLADQTDLKNALDAKAATSHNHDGVYSLTSHHHDAAYAAIGHNHDASYASAAHNHDGIYSLVAHNHNASYATINHNHDGVYSASGHNHDASYAAANHNHDASYSAAGHTHDYDNLTNKPTLGTAAAKNTGTGANDVAVGDHTHGGGSVSFNDIYPIGSVYFSMVNTPPATGTWVRIAQGEFIVGQKDADADFETVGSKGGTKTRSISAHAGAAVADHASHTHTYSEVINHTHAVNVTDPGHTHLTQRYPTATGGSSGFTIDTSMSGTPADNSLSTKSNVTGITATTSNPAGGVAQGTTQGPSATLSHNVTQPEAHADINIMPPRFVLYAWQRTA